MTNRVDTCGPSASVAATDAEGGIRDTSSRSCCSRRRSASDVSKAFTPKPPRMLFEPKNAPYWKLLAVAANPIPTTAAVLQAQRLAAFFVDASWETATIEAPTT